MRNNEVVTSRISQLTSDLLDDVFLNLYAKPGPEAAQEFKYNFQLLLTKHNSFSTVGKCEKCHEENYFVGVSEQPHVKYCRFNKKVCSRCWNTISHIFFKTFNFFYTSIIMVLDHHFHLPVNQLPAPHLFWERHLVIWNWQPTFQQFNVNYYKQRCTGVFIPIRVISVYFTLSL